jgi:phage tail-like protein
MADATAQASPGTWVDPYRAYNFRLEVQGVSQGRFIESSGIDIDVEAIPYREGGAGQIVHQVMGQVTHQSITLRWGLSASRELWDWFMKITRGEADRRNVSIILLASDGVTEVVRWNLNGAWPKAFRGVTLNSLSREIAIESLTLVFEGVERS